MPRGAVRAGTDRPSSRLSFFVQQHWTGRPHYDLYLELEGRLLGWMLPKPPSPDPRRRAFALRTDDRDLEFGRFEGVLPPGSPGEGLLLAWDLGTYEPYPPAGVPLGLWLDRGALKLHFFGERLRGLWDLVRWTPRRDHAETWVLVKLRDRHAVEGGSFEADARSAITGRTREEIAHAALGEAGEPRRAPPPDAAVLGAAGTLSG